MIRFALSQTPRPLRADATGKVNGGWRRCITH